MSETQKKYVIAGACSVGLVFFGWSLTKIAKKLSAKPEKQPASPTATQAKKHSPTKPLPPANKTAAKNKSKVSLPVGEKGDGVQAEGKRKPTLEEALAIAEEVVKEEKKALLDVQRKISESFTNATGGGKEKAEVSCMSNKVSPATAEGGYQKQGNERIPADDPLPGTIAKAKVEASPDPEDDLALPNLQQTCGTRSLNNCNQTTVETSHFIPTMTESTTFATPRRCDSDEPTTTAGFEYETWSTDITKEEESIGLSDYSVLGSEIGPGKQGIAISLAESEQGGEQLRRCLSNLIKVGVVALRASLYITNTTQNILLVCFCW